MPLAFLSFKLLLAVILEKQDLKVWPGVNLGYSKSSPDGFRSAIIE
jgi:hypothetical protein